jgi:hypothetical protein
MMKSPYFESRIDRCGRYIAAPAVRRVDMETPLDISNKIWR